MSAKENKAILQRLFKEFNQGNLNLLDELFAEDFVDRYPIPGEMTNKEGFKQFLAGTHETFPDWHWSLEDTIAEGDKVAYRFTMHGTDKGGYIGLPPTGREVSFPGVGMLRFAKGKIVERWTIVDSMTILHQLGLL